MSSSMANESQPHLVECLMGHGFHEYFHEVFTYLSKAEIVIQLLIWFLSLFYSVAKDVLKKDLLLP